MSNESDYKSAGARRSILCATFGLAIALTLIFSTFNVSSERLIMLVPVILGVTGLYAGAYFYGKFAGKLAHRVGIDSFKVWFIGILLAWSSVITMTFAGSLFSFAADFDSGDIYDTFYSYILLPLMWIAAIGWIPALILGLVWAVLMKRKFRIAS